MKYVPNLRLQVRYCTNSCLDTLTILTNPFLPRPSLSPSPLPTTTPTYPGGSVSTVPVVPVVAILSAGVEAWMDLQE